MKVELLQLNPQTIEQPTRIIQFTGTNQELKGYLRFLWFIASISPHPKKEEDNG